MVAEEEIVSVMNLITQRKYLQAAEKVEKLLVSDPKNVGLMLDLGYCYTNAEKFEKAVDIYTKVIQFYPKNEAGYVGLGFVYEHQGDFDKALEKFEESLKIAPENALVYFEMGEISLDLDEYENAIEYFNKAVKHGGPENDAKALDRLARCKLGLEKPDEAIEHAKKMLEIDSEMKVSAYNIIGIASYLKKDWEAAIKNFNAYLEIIPDDESTVNLLNEAEEELQKAKAGSNKKTSKKTK